MDAGRRPPLGWACEHRLKGERLAACHLRVKAEVCMPTYEYRCNDCKHVFNRVEPLAEHGKTPHCPKCKSKNVQQVLTPFFAKTSHKA